jgi:hypothetical protein
MISLYSLESESGLRRGAQASGIFSFLMVLTSGTSWYSDASTDSAMSGGGFRLWLMMQERLSVEKKQGRVRT